MGKFISALILYWTVMLTSAEPLGIDTAASTFSMSETVLRLTEAAKSKKMLIFANINFSQDAAKVGLSMNDSQLLIVGNPKGGTPAMQAVPLAALDLPLKILVWKDGNGKVWVSYNTPAYLRNRYGLTEEVARPLSSIVELVNSALHPE